MIKDYLVITGGLIPTSLSFLQPVVLSFGVSGVKQYRITNALPVRNSLQTSSIGVIKGYKLICGTFCVNFDEALYQWTSEFEIGIKPKLMIAERHDTMGIMINLINSFLIPFKKEKHLNKLKN